MDGIHEQFIKLLLLEEHRARHVSTRSTVNTVQYLEVNMNDLRLKQNVDQALQIYWFDYQHDVL